MGRATRSSVLLGMLALGLPSIVSAVPLVTIHYGTEITVQNLSFVAEGRIGDLGGAATFEFDLGPDTPAPAATAQYAWPNGTAVPFTLTYDNSTNLVSFTVGSDTLTYTPTPAFTTLYIRTRAADSGTGIQVDNLVLDGVPLGDVSSAANPGTGVQILQISGGTLADGFTLTGQSTMTWSSSPPTQSALAYQIKLADPIADLAVAKTASPDPVPVEQSLTYLLTVANNGPSFATGVMVSDPLPAGVTFVSATPSQGTCSEAAGMVTCDVGAVVNATSVTVTIVVTPTVVGTLSNSAGVTAYETDSVVGNNTTGPITTTVTASADLSITKTDSPDPALAGQNLTYAITVTNTGPSPAGNVTMTDALPVGVAFVSAIPSQGSCSGAGTVTCDLGDLANGASATVAIIVTPTAAGTLTNTASVSSSTADPNTANSTTPPVTTTVNTLADLSVIQVATPNPVDVGLPATFTITVTNGGPSTATGVTVNDTLPTAVTFDSATPGQGSCTAPSGGVFTCSLGTLANGGSATITLVVTTTTAGMIGNTASVTSDVGDPNLTNNSVTATTNVGDVARLINISARGFVQTGDNVMIGGFVVGGNVPKALLVRARGPSLAAFGVSGAMADPQIQLYSGQTLIAQNDNWQTTDPLCLSPATACGTATDVQNTGKSPCAVTTTGCTLDSAIYITLPQGAYTVILSGVGGGTGVGIVEVFDTDGTTLPKLVNISTRGLVLTGDSVMIGGFIIGSGTAPKDVLIRARGPSLAAFGVTGAMANPMIQLYSGQTLIAQNDDWQTTDPLCGSPAVACGTATDIQNTGKDPCAMTTTSCTLDSAIRLTLPPGPYTTILSGVGGGTGVGIVEIFDLSP